MNVKRLFGIGKALAAHVYQLAPAVFHPLRVVAPSYYRGKLSARAFARHYAHCREVYLKDGNPYRPAIARAYEVGVHVIYPNRNNNLFTLNGDYDRPVDRVARAVDERFKLASNCYFFPRLQSILPDTARTNELNEIKNGDVITVQLREFQGIDGLSELCSRILTALQERVYGSYVVADKIYIYRSLVSRQTEQISWLWHYDNHPNEILKVMIYLTDVDENTGPYGYLFSRDLNRPVKLPSVPNLVRPFIETRISPRQIERYARLGFVPFQLLGPKGTTCLFSENIIHKANIPKKGHRDVVVIQMRPVDFRPTSFIHENWTGSFQHVDVNPDPSLLVPIPKPTMASG